MLDILKYFSFFEKGRWEWEWEEYLGLKEKTISEFYKILYCVSGNLVFFRSI